MVVFDRAPSTWESVHVFVFPQLPCKLLKDDLAESPSTTEAAPNAVVTPTPIQGAHSFNVDFAYPAIGRGVAARAGASECLRG